MRTNVVYQGTKCSHRQEYGIMAKKLSRREILQQREEQDALQKGAKPAEQGLGVPDKHGNVVVARVSIREFLAGSAFRGMNPAR